MLEGLKNSAYIIVYRNGEKIVRSARVLWDRGYAACICNVMVLPKYQRKGIDSRMIKEIISYLSSQLENNDYFSSHKRKGNISKANLLAALLRSQGITAGFCFHHPMT